MMRRLFIADLKMILRNKQALFWALAFPIMFATIFGLFRLDRLPPAQVGIVSLAPGADAPLIAGLHAVPSIDLCDGINTCGPFRPGARTEAAATQAVHDGDLQFALIVRPTGDVTVVVNATAADRNRIFVPLFERVLDQVNIRLAGITPTYRLTTRQVRGHSTKYYDFVLPGLVGMAVMSYGIIGLGGTIAQWRGQKILRRIRATPLKPATFLSSVVLAHLVLALIQSALVLGFGVLVFGAHVKGNLLWIGVFVLLGNLTFLNIGFMIATRVESAEAASGVGNAVTMPMLFFSGVFFPTSTLPWILPRVTSLLPLHPLVDAIRSITLDGTSIVHLGTYVWQLAAWAGVTFLLARRVFRFETA